jgi:uncharacterized membrane protein
MASRSSRRRAALLAAAALVVLTYDAVTAGKPQGDSPPSRVEPMFDLASVVGVPSCANALNELGTIVGVRNEFGILRGFSWSAGAGAVDLGANTTALAVNDRGEIAGQGDVLGSGLDARVWTSAGTMTIAVGVAYSLNNRTQVVGFHLPPVGDPPINHGFRWTPGGGLEDVESLTGETPPWSYFAPLSFTFFIRPDGVMAGERQGAAVLWQPDGQLTTLGPGVAYSVNDLGVAVGATRLGDGNPVVWSGGTQTILTSAVGEAADINAAGYVVGWMLVGGARHAFVWHADHGLQDLGPGEALDIDEIGDVAGCLGSGDAARATVWQVEMTGAELLVGFESLARRLLADLPMASSHQVFRHIELAQKTLGRGRGTAAPHHLERALREIARLEPSAGLPLEWLAALQRIGQAIAGRL